MIDASRSKGAAGAPGAQASWTSSGLFLQSIPRYVHNQRGMTINGQNQESHSDPGTSQCNPGGGAPDHPCPGIWKRERGSLGHRVHGTAEQQDWKLGMERSHAEEQIYAVHSGHIEIKDRKIDGRKIVAQYLHRTTKQYNCVALQLQNPFRGAIVPVRYRQHRVSAFVRKKVVRDLRR